MSTTASHVSLIFKKLEPIDRVGEGNTLIIGLTANPGLFPALPMTLLVFAGINTTYDGKITAARGGDDLKIKERDDYYNDFWLPAMMGYANYVDGVAAGNATTIVTAGFHATKTTSTAHVQPIQMLLDAKGSSSGAMDFNSKTLVDSHSFTLIGGITGDLVVTEVGDHLVLNSKTDIVIFPTTNKRGHVNGLTRKDEMDFYIVANNGAGLGPVSNKGNVVIP